MPNRPKRPSTSSGSGGGRANINMGGLAGAMADSGNPATTAQLAGDYGSLDASGIATAPTATTAIPAGSQFAKPTMWQQMLSTPGASAYYQQQLQQSAAIQNAALQQQNSLYNAQTVDPILQGNATTALAARAPIQVQQSNAQHNNVSYDNMARLDPATFTTAQANQVAEQAQANAIQQAAINAGMASTAHRPAIYGITGAEDADKYFGNMVNAGINQGRLPWSQDIGNTTAQQQLGDSGLATTRANQANVFLTNNPDYTGSSMQATLAGQQMANNRASMFEFQPGTTAMSFDTDFNPRRSISTPLPMQNVGGQFYGKQVAQPQITNFPKPPPPTTVEQIQSVLGQPNAGSRIGQQGLMTTAQSLLNTNTPPSIFDPYSQQPPPYVFNPYAQQQQTQQQLSPIQYQGGNNTTARSYRNKR